MRPGAFAAAVAGRHRAAAGRLSRLPLVLSLPGRPAARSVGTVSRHLHQHRRVRVAISVRHSTLVTRGSIVHRLERATTEVRRERILAASPARSTALVPVIHRSARGQRVMATAAPVQRVVRGKVAEAPATPAKEPATMVSAARERAAFRAAPTPVSLPSLELDRVTDHVLKSLDRRMSSWRDRRGRT